MHASLFKNKIPSIGFIVLLAGGVLAYSGCKKESTPTGPKVVSALTPNGLIVQYFGNYLKAGNYWIYQTADGIQSDSLYVLDTAITKKDNSEKTVLYENVTVRLRIKVFGGPHVVGIHLRKCNCSASYPSS